MGACVSCPSLKIPFEQKFATNESFECAVYATQGRRRNMEDKHVMSLSLPNHPSYSLFGVFDGFNGNDASTYFAEHIVDKLDAITAHDLENNDAIIKAVCEMDTSYIHSTGNNSDEYNSNAGCTFVFALINALHPNDTDTDMPVSKLTLTPTNSLTVNSIPYVISSYTNGTTNNPITSKKSEYERLKEDEIPSATEDVFRVRIFWAGDSRAVLLSDNGPLERLTNDHVCSLPKEAERIVNAKGSIMNGRINGICEVTRCFGCHAMKNDPCLPPNQQKMISVPEHTTLICRNNDRLLIFCDGLIKKWNDTQLNARCKHHLKQHEEEKRGDVSALMYLCEQAMDEGSRDNITVVSIKFK